jgi:antitoxin HigA-1
MSAVHGIRLKNLAHPGGFVKNEIIEALGLSVTIAAQVLGVTRSVPSAVLNERAHVSWSRQGEL